VITAADRLLYESLSTRHLEDLLEAFRLDIFQGADPDFCRRRIDLIRELLARKDTEMTLIEMADDLDDLVIRLSQEFMPAADDPHRARKAYVLGIAAHAIRQRAEQLRTMAPAVET
jgi:hypothetical protein